MAPHGSIRGLSVRPRSGAARVASRRAHDILSRGRTGKPRKKEKEEANTCKTKRHTRHFKGEDHSPRKKQTWNKLYGDCLNDGVHVKLELNKRRCICTYRIYELSLTVCQAVHFETSRVLVQVRQHELCCLASFLDCLHNSDRQPIVVHYAYLVYRFLLHEILLG